MTDRHSSNRTTAKGRCARAIGAAAGWLGRRRRPGATAKRAGRYTLGEKIGQGAMGAVYKATHDLLDRPAAVKLLRDENADDRALEQFEREVQITSQLTHPNTIGIYDFGRTDDGSFYYAMEYLDGIDLQTLVEREGPLPPARVAHILAQAAGALDEAHRAGLLHRDVKPANVMVCRRGGIADVVKVIDFGLVEDLSAPAPGTAGDGQRITGTPLYLSPEAIAAPDAVGARSDLYALGAVAYFLLTGVPPFSGRNVVEVCHHHVSSDPIAPSRRLGREIPAVLERLILACLAKNLAGRPASAAALRDALLPLAAEWTEVRAAAGWREPTGERGAVDRAEPYAMTALAA